MALGSERDVGCRDVEDALWRLHLGRLHLWAAISRSRLPEANVDNFVFMWSFIQRAVEAGSGALRALVPEPALAAVGECLHELGASLGCESVHESSLLWETGVCNTMPRELEVALALNSLEGACEDLSASVAGDDGLRPSGGGGMDVDTEADNGETSGGAFAVTAELRDGAAEAMACLTVVDLQKCLRSHEAAGGDAGAGAFGPVELPAVDGAGAAGLAGGVVDRIHRMRRLRATVEVDGVGLEDAGAVRLPADYMSIARSIAAACGDALSVRESCGVVAAVQQM